MQQHSNHVDWALWLRTRPNDIRRPDKVINPIGNAWYCQLCGATSPVHHDRAKHHLEHMVDLDAWLAEQDEPTGPQPDSLRRSQDRRLRRQQQVEQAAAFDRDPYLYAVEQVDVGLGHLGLRERPRLQVGGDIGPPHERLPQPLDLDDRRPPHDRFGGGAGDAELGAERLAVEQLGEAVGHTPLPVQP
ncbi:MAG: hypothetical protein ACM3QU_11790 [Verrucomicrobiota bacterium]